MRPDPDLPVVFTRAEARRRGLTDDQIDYRLRQGLWVPEARGTLRLKATPAPPKLAAAKALAAVRAVGSDRAVVSHTSAAAYWRLPAPLGPGRVATLTAETGTGRSTGRYHLRIAPLPPVHVRGREARVTSPARTVLDVLRTLPPRDGLAVADAALRRRLVKPEDLAAMAEFQQGWPGIAQARDLLDLADAVASRRSRAGRRWPSRAPAFRGPGGRSSSSTSRAVTWPGSMRSGATA